MQIVTLQVEEPLIGSDGEERVQRLEGILREVYAQALAISRENNDLETSLGIWYKMELFCEKVIRLGKNLCERGDHLSATALVKKAEEMGFACRARWKNIKTEVGQLDK